MSSPPLHARLSWVSLSARPHPYSSLLSIPPRLTAINPGNSGGPLVDAEGGLIAVADLKRANSAGIAMFIPIAEALDKLGLKVE